MKQKDLAQALGIDPAAVSRLKMKGMPIDSVDAAQAWRRRNVAPYAKSPTPPPRPPAHSGGAPWATDRATADPRLPPAQEATVEALLREHALVPRRQLAAAIGAVDELIQWRREAGRDGADLRPLLCGLLMLQPEDERLMSMAAWSVATGFAHVET